jgi:tetratricopeptide (TPR) repeat protein
VGNLGVTYRTLGAPQRAIEFFEQRLTIAQRTGDQRGEGFALWNKSLALEMLGDRIQAIACAEAAHKMLQEIKCSVSRSIREQLAQWRRAVAS